MSITILSIPLDADSSNLPAPVRDTVVTVEPSARRRRSAGTHAVRPGRRYRLRVKLPTARHE